MNRAGIFSCPLAGQEGIAFQTVTLCWYFQGDTDDYPLSLSWSPAQNHAIRQLWSSESSWLVSILDVCYWGFFIMPEANSCQTKLHMITQMQIMSCLHTHYEAVNVEVGLEKLRSEPLSLTVSSVNLEGCLIINPCWDNEMSASRTVDLCFNNKLNFQNRERFCKGRRENWQRNFQLSQGHRNRDTLFCKSSEGLCYGTVLKITWQHLNSEPLFVLRLGGSDQTLSGVVSDGVVK